MRWPAGLAAGLAAVALAAPPAAASRVVVRLAETVATARVSAPRLGDTLVLLAGRRGFFPLVARGAVPPPSPGEAMRCSVGWGAFKRDVVSSRAILAPPRTRVVFPLVLPQGARLETGALAWAPGGGPPVRFEVTIAVPGGAEEVVWTSEVGPRRQLVEEEGSWRLPWRGKTEPPVPRRASVDLSPWAGRRVELNLRTSTRDSGPQVAAAFWLDPQIVGDAGDPRPETVLVIILDSVRADEFDQALSWSDSLASLAARGTRFRNAWANGTWTRTSTLSLLTSRDARESGLPVGNYAVPESARDLSRGLAIPTLAEELGRAGYSSAAFGDNLFISPTSELGADAGFDEVHFRGFEGATRRGVDRALAWAAARPGRPLLLVVHLPGVHRPRRPPPAAWVRLALGRPRALLGHPVVAASLAHAGEEAGRLLEGLAALGRKEPLVALVADHGRPDSAVRAGTVKGVLDEGVLRVPFVLAGPGVPRSEVSGTVQLLDVMPTLLDLAGVGVPDGLGGRSLRPVLDGTGGFPEREVIVAGALRDVPEAVVRGGRVVVARGERVDRGADPGRPAADREVWVLEVPPGAGRVRGSVGVVGGRVRWAWPEGFGQGDVLTARPGRLLFRLGEASTARRVLLLPDPPSAAIRVVLRAGGSPVEPRRIALGGAALRPTGNPFLAGGGSAPAARSPWYPASPRDGAEICLQLVGWQRYTAAGSDDAAIGGGVGEVLASWGYR